MGSAHGPAKGRRSACQRRLCCAGPRPSSASPDPELGHVRDSAHARTQGVEEEYLSLRGAMGNARLSGSTVGHDGRSYCRAAQGRI
jgi:hypothetical protein